MIAAAVVCLGLAAAPEIVVEGAGAKREAVERQALLAWGELEKRFTAATGAAPALSPWTVRVRCSGEVPPGRGGLGRPGLVVVRAEAAGDAGSTALGHEIAHQFLWAACPAGAEDRLFHEAFALAASGEIEAWTAEGYLSLPRAVAVIAAADSLDDRTARRAIARLVTDAAAGVSGLPAPLERRLRQCASSAAWGEPMTAVELAGGGEDRRGDDGLADAAVVLSRHSGEVLLAVGGAAIPLPFGSTLKPFVVAGSGPEAPPRLPPRLDREEWQQCGPDLPAALDAGAALLRSCNGYFIDWAATAPAIAGFGAYGPLLVALGLERLPADVTEAIGMRATLRLSPLGLARAYRVLAEARPDLIELLGDNAVSGTLRGLGLERRLAGVATKTGTVRDAELRPQLGWIAGVTADHVVVMARRGRAPKSNAREFADLVEQARRIPAARAARVHVFTLLAGEPIELRCAGVGLVLEAARPRLLGRDFTPLERVVASAGTGPALCLDGDFRVRFRGTSADGRAYAGTFAGAPAGADFRTTIGRYTAGVLAAEEDGIDGPARAALARVVAHNVGHSRHGASPVCDTTHCQVFRGTAPALPGDARSLARPPLATTEWLLFSRGGDEPWRERRPIGAVASAIGERPSSLRFDAGRTSFTFTVAAPGGGAAYEETAEVGCEALRGPLKLPSCPDTATIGVDEVEFSGRGRGHGLGLDVARARQSGASEDEILRDAYGF